MAYSFTKSITISHLKVGTVNNTDQTNFPVLIGGSAGPYTYLKTVGNGGNVQNTVSFNGQTVPADLIFASDSAGASPLKWEVASYKATTGDIEVWVKIPTLSHTVDTVIYMLYGDVAVVTYQGGAVGDVWDTNFKLVHHYPDGTTLAVKDSTSNTNDGTIVGTITAATGQIDGALNSVTVGNNDVTVNDAVSLRIGTKITISAWVNQASRNANGAFVAQKRDPIVAAMNFNYALFLTSAGKQNFEFNDGSYEDMVSTTAVPLNSWNHITVAVDESAGTKITFYLNGASDGTPTYTGTMPSAGTAPMQIGNYGAFLTGFFQFNGSIDELRISNSTRNADWVVTEYNNQNSPSTFYSVAVYPPVSTDGWLLPLIHPRGTEEETPYYKRNSAFFLTNGVPPPIPIVPFFTHRRIVDPNLWNEEERINKHIPAWFLPQNRPTPLSPFVGNPSLVRKNLVSFLNIRSESQQIRVSQNLSRVKPQTISHAMDAIQDYGDVTDSRLRDLNTGVSSVTASQAVTAKGLASGAFGIYGVYMPNPTYPPAYMINSVSMGNVDVYTVPSGRKALLLNLTSTPNAPFGGAINIYMAVKIAGSYYRLSNANNNGSQGEDLAFNANVGIRVLNAGETAAFNADNTGISAWLHLVEFDASSPLRSVTLTSFVAGNNTLYTVPAGKTFEVLQDYGNIDGRHTLRSKVNYSNNSGGAVFTAVWAVPNGGSISVYNQIGPSGPQGPGTFGYLCSLYGSLAPGDFIVVNVTSSAAGQMAWMNIIEH